MPSPHPFGENASSSGIKSPLYSESHHRLRVFLREYLEKNIFPYAKEWEHLVGEIPGEVYQNFAKHGLILQSIPRRYRHGNRGHPVGIADDEWDHFHSIIVTEEFHRCPYNGVMWGLTGGNAIGCPPILNYGSEEQRMHFLPRVDKGEIRFCLAITEPEAGSDVASIRTTAALDSSGTHYVVDGHKKWITNGIWADYATTAVRTGGAGASGLSLLIIPLKNTPGVTVRRIPTSGMYASGSTFISFSSVRVPRENLIGQENHGFKMIMANFNPERLSLAVGALRLARTCYSEAFAHALRRKTFGKRLIENQIIRAKLAGMVRNIESTQAWIEQIVYHMKQTKDSAEDPNVGARLALAKVQAGKTLELCCREAQQIFGGLGVTKDGLGGVVEQISRDMRVWVVGGGSEEILDDLGVRMGIGRL